MAATTDAGRTALIAALELALPYVESIAARQPTAYHNLVKQRQAVKDAFAIRAALSAAKSGGAQ